MEVKEKPIAKVANVLNLENVEILNQWKIIQYSLMVSSCVKHVRRCGTEMRILQGISTK